MKRLPTLADQDEKPRRNLMPSRRPAHAVVTVKSPEDLEPALKVFKQQRDLDGVSKLMKPTGVLFGHYTPGQKRRMKSGRHRAMIRRAEAKRAMYEQRRADEKRPSWRNKGVIVAPAA
jgi:hypothetical protein